MFDNYTINRKGEEWLKEFKAELYDQYGAKADTSNLAIEFLGAKALAPRMRVRVLFPGGQTVWGYVGVTCGWKPTLLLMRRLGQRGSSLLIGKDCKILDKKFK